MSDKLAEIEASLPPVPTPAGNYVHAVRTGNLLFLAGKGPISDVQGKVGADFTKEQAFNFVNELEVWAQEKGWKDVFLTDKEKEDYLKGLEKFYSNK